jgi:hypothetical protein
MIYLSIGILTLCISIILFEKKSNQDQVNQAYTRGYLDGQLYQKYLTRKKD